MKRKSGVLLHISSLPGNYGCGSFGAEAKHFIDVIAASGFSYWQVLPFCIPDSFASPYSSVSTFSGNPNFIDLDILFSNGLVTRAELESARAVSPYSCDFGELHKTHMPILMRAAERAAADKTIAAKTDEFMASHPKIADLCRFLAIKSANGGKSWLEWTTDACPDKLLSAWRFIEYEFFRQWEAVLRYAHERGIYVIGDIPFYVSLDSSDVYFDKKEFQLDEDGRPAWVAGVPPDYFSADGQLWDNPLYDWDAREKDDFSFWRERIGFMLELFDGVRIDHFRAIESYYRIKAGSENARGGEWRRGPGKPFVDMINDTAGGKLVIAEDLGDITDDVRSLLEYSGFPGMKVLQFGFLGCGDSSHRPHHYINNCVAYTGTHDNNTLLGAIWEMPPHVRDELFEYCGCPSDWNAARERVVKTVLASSAGLAVIPMQDILGYGADTRMNTPGVASGNWKFRVTRDQLDGIDKNKYRRMNELYARYRG